MDFEADIHLTVRVPFSADVDELGEPELEAKDSGQQGLVDPSGHEKRARKIERQRTRAAKAADELAKSMTASRGEVIGAYVEEVRER